MERGGELGGDWRWNYQPGASCPRLGGMAIGRARRSSGVELILRSWGSWSWECGVKLWFSLAREVPLSNNPSYSLQLLLCGTVCDANRYEREVTKLKKRKQPRV